MKVDFYICRHGQTDGNVKGIWAGSETDIPLNEIGRQQAWELADKLRGKSFDVYSSPLIRAVQTANIIARGCDVTIMQNLRECNFGVAEGSSFAQTKEIYGEDFVNALLWPTEETADLRFPNGESKREVFERVDFCLSRIISRHTLSWSKPVVCVVCHAGVFSALQFGLRLKNVPFANGAVVHLVYDTELRQFVQIFD